MRIDRAVVLISAALIVLAANTANAESPPTGSQPLSAVLESVEKSPTAVVVSADFERGRWEIVACSDDGKTCRELYVDPITAREQRSSRVSPSDAHAPRGGKSASQLARSIEERKLGVITELEYEDARWEASLRGDGVRAKLYLDPATGDIRRCRGRGCPSN